MTDLPKNPKPCAADGCLALARVVPRLIFKPHNPAPNVSGRSAIILRLPLCEDCGEQLKEDPGRFMSDTRWRDLDEAHRASGREMPDRDEVEVELLPLAAWDRPLPHRPLRIVRNHPADRDPF